MTNDVPARPCIHLTFTAEGDWPRHASAMLHSALSRTPEADFECYVMYAEDSATSGLENLEAVAVELGARLHRLPIPVEQLQGLPTRHFHRSAWYRILLPDLLPDIQRAIYLDADTIVTDSLMPLWETPLAGALFAAATNPLYPFMPDWPKERLGIADPRLYINSGVLLLDLDAMRRVAAVAAIREYGARHPENTCPEQDALSALYHDRFKLLHPRWNVQNTLFDLRDKELPFSKEEIAEARSNPAIVHFIAFKPWQYVCSHPLRHLYHEHLAHTPWQPLPLEDKTWFNRLLYPFPVSWRHYALKTQKRARKFVNRLRKLPGRQA